MAKKLKAIMLEKDLIVLGNLTKFKLRDLKSPQVAKTILLARARFLYLRTKFRLDKMNIH